MALSGSIVGTVLGWLLLHPLLAVYGTYYNLPILFIRPHIPYLLISLLLPLMIFLPFTYLLVRRVLRIPPVLLMKGGELKTKVNLLERSIRLRRFSFTTRFKIREILRSLPRVIFLTVGVILVTLLLLLGFVTKDSMEYLVQDNFQNVYHYKYEYVFNGLQSTPRSGDIASAAPFSLKNNPKQSIIIYGLQKDNNAIQLKDMNGKKLSFDSVIINKSLADKLGVTNGDTLKVKSQLTNKTNSITIHHIANSYLGDVIYMPLKSFNQLNGYPEGSYTEIYSNHKLDINPDLLMDTINAKATVDGYKQLIQPLNYGVGGIAIAAGVIAVIIIYILISLLIDESSYKISLMKIIGYEDRSIRGLMINYYLWFVILGFVIGIPVTLSSISAFFDSITAEMSISIPVTVQWINVVVAFGILLVAYYLSLLLNRRKIKRISMYEAIKRSTE